MTPYSEFYTSELVSFQGICAAARRVVEDICDRGMSNLEHVYAHNHSMGDVCNSKCQGLSIDMTWPLLEELAGG
jgi:hypothetical protein